MASDERSSICVEPTLKGGGLSSLRSQLLGVLTKLDEIEQANQAASQPHEWIGPRLRIKLTAGMRSEMTSTDVICREEFRDSLLREELDRCCDPSMVRAKDEIVELWFDRNSYSLPIIVSVMRGYDRSSTAANMSEEQRREVVSDCLHYRLPSVLHSLFPDHATDGLDRDRSQQEEKKEALAQEAVVTAKEESQSAEPVKEAAKKDENDGWTSALDNSSTFDDISFAGGDWSSPVVNQDWSLSASPKKKSASNQEYGDEDDEDNGGKITFKPIVSLKQQSVETGTENETELAAIPFRVLYRWGPDVAGVMGWKSRATMSTLYIYKDEKKTGKTRLICREMATLKLRMNHFVPHSKEMGLNSKGKNMWNWKGIDTTIAFEDDSVGLCQFALKFTEDEQSQQFEQLFNEAAKQNRLISEGGGSHVSSAVQTVTLSTCKSKSGSALIHSGWNSGNDGIFQMQQIPKEGTMGSAVCKKASILFDNSQETDDFHSPSNGIEWNRDVTDIFAEQKSEMRYRSIPKKAVWDWEKPLESSPKKEDNPINVSRSGFAWASDDSETAVEPESVSKTSTEVESAKSTAQKATDDTAEKSRDGGFSGFGGSDDKNQGWGSFLGDSAKNDDWGLIDRAGISFGSSDTAEWDFTKITAKKSKSKEEVGSGEDNCTEITFKPIVTLQEQKVDPGHESETLIAEVKFKKLHRYGKDVTGVPGWKQRAIDSKAQFWQANGDPTRIRVVVRDAVTAKLRLNHYVPSNEAANFQFGRAGKSICQWIAGDSTIRDEEDDPNYLCPILLSFYDDEEFTKFGEMFQKSIEHNRSLD